MHNKLFVKSSFDFPPLHIVLSTIFKDRPKTFSMAYRKNTDSDGKKLYFPEGALLNQMEVAVVESERRKSDILKEPFIVYLVESRQVRFFFNIIFSHFQII